MFHREVKLFQTRVKRRARRVLYVVSLTIEISFVLVPILLKFSPAGGVQESNIHKIGKEKKKRGETRQKDKGTKARTKDDKTKTQGEARQK